MFALILGVIIWSLVHFVPATVVDFRSSLIKKLGLNPYKGIFSLVLAGSLALMIFGWKSAPVEFLYASPLWGRWITAIAMLLTSILFIAPYISNSLGRVIRHPQLTGVMIFGIAHLVSNGESRSLVLFGGLAAWAFLEMLLINRRDGAWQKPAADKPVFNFRLILAGLGFFALVMAVHPWLFGVSPVP